MSATGSSDLVLRLPPLDPATATCLLELCGHLQQAIWQTYGDQIEAYWSATEPEQLLYGPLTPDKPPPHRASGRKRTRHQSRGPRRRRQ